MVHRDSFYNAIGQLANQGATDLIGRMVDDRDEERKFLSQQGRNELTLLALQGMENIYFAGIQADPR